MPRTKLDKKPDPLLKLIYGQMGAMGIDIEDIEIPGLSSSTLRRRLRQPDDFTRGELRALCMKLHIPIEELRQSITLR